MNLIWLIPAEGSGNRAPNLHSADQQQIQAATLHLKVAAFSFGNEEHGAT
jgi:hypothetical protein